MLLSNDNIKKTVATKSDSPLIKAIYADEVCKMNYENIRAFLRQEYPALKFIERAGKYSVRLENEQTSVELRFSLLKEDVEFMLFYKGRMKNIKKLRGEIDFADIRNFIEFATKKEEKRKNTSGFKTVGEEIGVEKDAFADMKVEQLKKFGCTCVRQLKRANIHTVKEVLEMTEKGLSKIRGIGTAKVRTIINSFSEMRDFLNKYGKASL